MAVRVLKACVLTPSPARSVELCFAVRFVSCEAELPIVDGFPSVAAREHLPTANVPNKLAVTVTATATAVKACERRRDRQYSRFRSCSRKRTSHGPLLQSDTALKHRLRLVAQPHVLLIRCTSAHSSAIGGYAPPPQPKNCCLGPTPVDFGYHCIFSSIRNNQRL